MDSVYQTTKDYSKAVANVIQKLQLSVDEWKIIMDKGENPLYQHFLLFPKYFIKTSVGLLKLGIIW